MFYAIGFVFFQFDIICDVSGQKYDEQKEEEALRDKKRKQLTRVESLQMAEEAAGKSTTHFMEISLTCVYSWCVMCFICFIVSFQFTYSAG